MTEDFKIKIVPEGVREEAKFWWKETMLQPTDEEIKYAVNVINGIAHHISRHGWSQPDRNTMAVDFSLAAFVLGYDGEDLFDEIAPLMGRPKQEFRGGWLLDCIGTSTQDSYHYASDRIGKVDQYVERWMYEEYTVINKAGVKCNSPFTMMMRVYGIDIDGFAESAAMDDARVDGFEYPLEIVVGSED